MPEPRDGSDASTAGGLLEEQRSPRQLPLDDPSFIAMHLVRKMNEPAFFQMLQMLNQMAQERDAGEFEKFMRQFTEQPAQAG